jgi:hypothetical protein
MKAACPLWVISGQTVGAKIGRLSVVTPIADKHGRNWIVRYVPEADIKEFGSHQKKTPGHCPGLRDQ